MSAFKDSLLEAEENALTTDNNAVDATTATTINDTTNTDATDDFDAKVATLAMTDIDLSFTNTRRKLPQADIDSLKASIQSVGLLSAVTVKPIGNGKYALIAGFKRFEAMTQLGKTYINAILLDENASEAHTTEANLAENFNRSGLSLADQCTAVKRLFTVLEGDDSTKADIIAVRLNMTPKQIKDRLVLAALIEDAMLAFDDGKIALKTAIVLATLTDEQQAEHVAKLVTGKMTHDDLLAAVGKATVSLSQLAKFDTTDCQQCPHNSEVQGSLFADADGSCGTGTCNNIDCFKAKSKAWFDNRRAEMETEFGTVIPVSQVETSAISPLSAEQLGDEQLNQCASCSDNISLIQNKMSEKFGDVINYICRNKTCFTDCAKKFAEAQATPDANELAVDVMETDVSDHTVQSEVSTAPTTSTKATKPAKADKPAAVAKLSKAGIQSARVAAAKIQIGKGLSEAVDSKMLMFLAVMRLTGNMMGYNVTQIAEIPNMDDATLRDTINNALLTYLAKGEKESGEANDSYPVGNILLTLLSAKGQLDDAIIQSWTVAELKHTTKGGIKQALIESGFKDHLEAKEKGAFTKLMSEKVPDIHTALEATDFDFSQYAPKAYIEAVQKVASSIN